MGNKVLYSPGEFKSFEGIIVSEDAESNAGTPEKTLIVSSDCEACRVLVEALKSQNMLGKYSVIDAASDKGREVIEQLGVRALPECVIIVKDRTGEIGRLCSAEEMNEIVKEAGGAGDRAG